MIETDRDRESEGWEQKEIEMTERGQGERKKRWTKREKTNAGEKWIKKKEKEKEKKKRGAGDLYILLLFFFCSYRLKMIL